MRFAFARPKILVLAVVAACAVTAVFGCASPIARVRFEPRTVQGWDATTTPDMMARLGHGPSYGARLSISAI